MKIPILDQYLNCWKSTFRDKGSTDGLAGGRRHILFGAVSMTLAATLLDGNFYTTILILLLNSATPDESAFFNAFLTAIGTFGIAFQLISPFVFGKRKRRKGLVLTFRAFFYFAKILYPLPLLLEGSLAFRAWMLAGLVIVASFCQAVAQPALVDWHLGTITGETRADYYSVQTAAINIINGVFGLAVSITMDAFKVNGKLLLCVILMRAAALLLVAIEFAHYSKVKEFPYPVEDSKSRLNFASVFLTPFKHREFMMTVLIYVVMCLGAGFPGSFYGTYLISEEGANVSYTYISLITIAAIPCGFVSVPFWNKMIHKIGWYRVMMVSGFLYATCHLINVFVTKNTQFMYIISGVYCQLVCQGYSLFTANLPYLRLPKESRNGCVAFFNVVGALAQTLSTALGGVFIKLTNGHDWHVFGLVIENRAYICTVTFGLYFISLCLCYVAYRRDKKRGVSPSAVAD